MGEANGNDSQKREGGLRGDFREKVDEDRELIQRELDLNDVSPGDMITLEFYADEEVLRSVSSAETISVPKIEETFLQVSEPGV